MIETVLAAVTMLGVWSYIEFRSWRLSNRRLKEGSARARSATDTSEVVDETSGIELSE